MSFTKVCYDNGSLTIQSPDYENVCTNIPETRLALQHLKDYRDVSNEEDFFCYNGIIDMVQSVLNHMINELEKEIDPYEKNISC